MNFITRRRFLKRVAGAGAGALLFPCTFDIKGQETAPEDKLSPLLLIHPCLTIPTDSGITVNIAAAKKDLECRLKYKEAVSEDSSWITTEPFSIKAYTPYSFSLKGLKPDTSYKYMILARPKTADNFETVTQNFFSTQKTDKSSYSFAMIADSHITPDEPERLRILSAISKSILAGKPDFLVMLGDNIQTFTSHGGPIVDKRYGPVLYYMLRHGLGNIQESVPLFNVIGNWEGENGWHDEKFRAWARNARMAWMPGPSVLTYPEGGTEYGDYFGFKWGDTLNIVLTVTGYTTVEHIHGSKVGKGNDWTLGEKQKKWLYRQLSESDARWKFIFIHHTVGGKAGDDLNTRYGRGGGHAAYTGEQKTIHGWMKEFNVNALFYGHDHVFTDIPVDGIHYVCAGSAGAPWKFTADETGYDNFIPDSGYTRVDVSREKLAVSFITPDNSTEAGKILHRFEIAHNDGSFSLINPPG